MRHTVEYDPFIDSQRVNFQACAGGGAQVARRDLKLKKPKSETRNSKPQTQNLKLETLRPKLTPAPETRNLKSEILRWRTET